MTLGYAHMMARGAVANSSLVVEGVHFETQWDEKCCSLESCEVSSEGCRGS